MGAMLTAFLVTALLCGLVFTLLLFRDRFRSDIYIGPVLYMRRWKFLPETWPGFRLHQIVRSDADRELHDHPFSFVSIILAGGYIEERPGRPNRFHGPGSILFRRAEDLHRICIDPRKGPAWTFVLRGPYRRMWGFRTAKGWMPWHQFIAEKTSGPDDRPFSAPSSIR